MEKSLTLKTLSPFVLNAQYAVRGTVVIKAEDYEAKRRRGEQVPYDKIYPYNVGNPHALGMKPITFGRQIMSILVYPQILENPKMVAEFPLDVVQKAQYYLNNCKGGVGAYSPSKGVLAVRQQVCEFIKRRDGVGEVDPENIFLCKGASNGAELILRSLIGSENDGIMVSIPQYPLYSALISLYGGTQLEYYMDVENEEWVCSVSHIKEQIDKARAKGINVRAIVVINPGNPVPNVFNPEILGQIIELAAAEKIVLIADEVYWNNIWDPSKSFVSMRKIAIEKQNQVEIFSLFSVSKGFYGECGFRGGYLECYNIDPAIVDQLYKIASISLANVDGQMMIGIVVSPPNQGDASFELFETEKNINLDNMKKIAQLAYSEFNSTGTTKCSKLLGSMYAFVEIQLSQKAQETAKSKNQAPDLLYCLECLDKTGITFVPGSGFGQKPGKWHFRTTILGSYSNMVEALEKWKVFEHEFQVKYADQLYLQIIQIYNAQKN